MSEPLTQAVLNDFEGMFSNADPKDVPTQGAQVMVNIGILRPGEMTVRGGLRPVKFEVLEVPPDPPTPLIEGLVAYYKLDELADTDATDSHTGGITLTKHGGIAGPGSVAGKLNTCRTFDSADSQYFSVSAPAINFAGVKDFLISTWLWFNNNATPCVIMQRWFQSVGTNRQWILARNSDDTLTLSVSAGAASVSSPAVLAAGWHHVLAWRDTANNQIGLAIDNGIPVTQTYSGASSVNTSSRALFFGSGDFAPTLVLDGRMDETGIWIGQTYTATAATNLYGGGTPPAYPFTKLTF